MAFKLFSPKLYRLGALFVSSILAIAIFTERAKAEEMARLTIGAVLPLTGAQTAFGQEAERGFDLALALVKKRDAQLGNHISLVVADDFSTAKGAGGAAEKLIDKERAQILVGTITTASTLAVQSVAKTRQTPFVIPLSPAAKAGGPGIFRVAASETQQAAALAAYTLQVLQVKQVATLHADDPQAQSFIQLFTAAYKAGGGTVTGDEILTFQGSDPTEQLTRIKAQKVKYIVASLPFQLAQSAFTTAWKLDPNLKFLGNDGWDTPALFKGPQTEATSGHSFVVQFAADDPTPATAEFVKAFQATYGRAPGVVAALAFDSLNIIVDAFRRARTNMKAPLTQALDRTREYPGVTGALTFYAGEASKSLPIKETRNGEAFFKAKVATGPAASPVPMKSPKAEATPTARPEVAPEGASAPTAPLAPAAERS